MTDHHQYTILTQSHLEEEQDEGSWIEISSSSSNSSASTSSSSDTDTDDDDNDDELPCDFSSIMHEDVMDQNRILSSSSSSQCDYQSRNEDDSIVAMEPSSHTNTKQPTNQRGKNGFRLCLLLLPLLLAVTKFKLRPSIHFDDNNDSIYVPGVGFSGFWFSLGRLKSIPDPATKHFVCFSAGCLGSVAVLNGFSVDEMSCMAQSAQLAWKKGQIGRYQVVSDFVDGLVYRNFPVRDGVGGGNVLSCLNELNLVQENTDKNGTTNLGRNPKLLSRLHILTTTTSLKTAQRSPTTLQELRDMLIQTTWMYVRYSLLLCDSNLMRELLIVSHISCSSSFFSHKNNSPMATGNGFSLDGHMDGGFSLLEHPKCTKSVLLPLDLGLMMNSLNVEMGIDEAYRLWNYGLAYGL